MGKRQCPAEPSARPGAEIDPAAHLASLVLKVTPGKDPRNGGMNSLLNTVQDL